MIGGLPYFAIVGKGSIILYLSIITLLVLIILTTFVIENNCNKKIIKKFLYLGLIIQIIIVIIDHFITGVPTITIDPRAFEALGWFSYENGVNVGRGEYNYWIINPIYKLLKVRVPIIFSALNVFFTILINLNIYKSLELLKINFKIEKYLMFIVIFSPISLIMKAGIQREAIIILFCSYSLKNFIKYYLFESNIFIIKAFFQIILATIFHSGVLFLSIGYFIYLITGKGRHEYYKYLLFIFIAIIFFIFRNRLLETVGGGSIENILSWNNYYMIKEARSAYLVNVVTTNLVQLLLYLPLFIFYFLYSPTPDMIKGVLDIATFSLNSSIYIFFTLGSLFYYRKISKRLNLKERKIINSLFFSLVVTIIVFSLGTRNAGTAMRHRDKLMPIIVILFAMLQNKSGLLDKLIRRKNEKIN